MRFNIFLLLLAFSAFAEEIEVRLKTATELKPLYLSRVALDADTFDWRYFEELRTVLEFDINTGGFATVVSAQEELEQALQGPNVKRQFSLPLWRKQKIPFVVALQTFQGALQITVFNVEKGTSKRYPDQPLIGKLDIDRKNLHLLSDTIHKDLFGLEGVASLRLIYSQKNKDPSLSDVWISDADGGNAMQATDENSYCVTPSFFPSTAGLDNPHFYFVSYKTGQSKIYRSSLQNGHATLAIDLRGNQVLPSINAKGTQMAFIADAAGRPDLFLQSFDPKGHSLGKSRQIFSTSRATQASPTFSPDGKKIAFVSDKDGPPRIYVIDVLQAKETKRAHPRLLTKKHRENTSPSWSPDGKKLAYSAKVDGIRQIWLYDFATEEEISLTTGPDNKENPAWAPDSLHLTFNTENSDEGQIFLMNLKQREPIQISKGPGLKRFACWETR